MALGPGGALEALVEARERGHVRFLGVTGHGTRAAAMHLASLERFPFDSVLLPYNFTMLAQPDYAADALRLLAVCAQRGVAVQTIKAIARRRWGAGDERRYSCVRADPRRRGARTRRPLRAVEARLVLEHVERRHAAARAARSGGGAGRSAHRARARGRRGAAGAGAPVRAWRDGCELRGAREASYFAGCASPRKS